MNNFISSDRCFLRKDLYATILLNYILPYTTQIIIPILKYDLLIAGAVEKEDASTTNPVGEGECAVPVFGMERSKLVKCVNQ